MTMTKSEFLRLLQFPTEWLNLGMYPDELFEWQLNGYERGHEEATEHDRNGAFHWWLRKGPTDREFENLLRLTEIDPDPLLGADVRRHIRAAIGGNPSLLAALRERL